MKYLATIILAFISIPCCLAGCSKSETTNEEEMTGNKIKITVSETVYMATLYDNATANAFRELLPMTIIMSELNGNEKYYYLPNTLPANASAVGSIQAGDLMLYGNNCLVLFYKSFSTSYSYTRIGKINEISGLAAALGAGSVTVTYELYDPTTDIEDLKNGSNIQVYPNPTSDYITVSGEIEQLTLLNGNGAVIAETKQNTVCIDKYPKGVYLLKIKIKNKQESVRKIIKS